MKPSAARLNVHLLVGILAGLTLASPGRADTTVAAPRPDVVVADFEGTNFGAWQVTGEAFGAGPAHGTLPDQMPVDGFLGAGFASSYHHGDGSVGTLTSPPFKLERKYLEFLIGGGGFAGQTCVNLICAGKVVRSATGNNIHPGGSERLAWQAWDVRELAGQTAVVEIVDRATGGWGHLSLDQLVQSDEKRADVMVVDAVLPFQAAQRYLNLPVKNGAPKRVVRMVNRGKVVREFDIELADGKPDWWAFLDLTAFRGQPLELHVDKLPADSQALSLVAPSDAIKDDGNLYREELRPQFHYTQRRGWNNDPNGLVFYQGEFHLFYQHNPYGWDWGNMHWGHATSRDLVHWTEQPEALYPDQNGTIYSGSAVVDWANTSGFGQAGRPPLVLIYTSAGEQFTQRLAYSTDGGLSFEKYAGNPVVRQISEGNRDPKVFWYAPTKQWFMVLWVELDKKNTIHFLTSPNLKEWTVVSHADGFFECPDFFELPVEDNPASRKWVLTAASSEYEVGSFDGRQFTAETAKLPGQRGDCFYAAQTFSDIPAPDGRRIQIGWLRAASTGMPFNQCQSVPLELKLLSTPDGVRLARLPVRELAQLRGRLDDLGAFTLSAGAANPLAAVRGETLELRAEFEPAPDGELQFTVRGATIGYNTKRQELTVNGQVAAAPLRHGKQQIIVYLDRTSIEVFASDGLAYVPLAFLPKADNQALGVQVQGGSAKFNSLQVYQLNSMWK